MRSPECHITKQEAVRPYVHNTVPAHVVDAGDGNSRADRIENQNCWPPPLGIVIVSVVQVATFLADLVNAGTDMADGPVATKLILTPSRRFEAWRFVTYMFVHCGTTHLAANLILQLVLGVPLEMEHGWWRVLIVYIAGVVAGSLGTSVTDPYVSLDGASAGVYAIILAHIANIIMNWSEMKWALYRTAIQLFLMLLVGEAIYNRYILKVTSVGYVSHFAGALAGLLVGIIVLRTKRVQSWRKKVRRIGISIYLFFMLGAIAWHIFYDDYFPEPDRH